MRVALTTVLELIGMLLIVTAAFFADWRLGNAAAGAWLVLLAYRIDGEVES